MRLQNVAPLYTRAGIDLIVKQYRDNERTVYDRMVNQDSSKAFFYRVGSESDLAPATITNEGTGVLYQDFLTPFLRDVYFFKRSVGFAVSTEAMESDFYGIIASKLKKMTKSVIKAMEINVSGFMNLATNTATTGPNSIVTPDGLPWASAAHLLDNGTASNILAGNPSLSITSLELAIQSITRQPSGTGEPEMIMGPYTLWVPPELEGLANRLMTSQAQPQGNDNDPNWAGTHVTTVISNPYFQSTTAWALVGQGDMNPFMVINRRAATFKSQEDIDKDVMKNVLTQIWTILAKDWRGTVYSAGA